MNSRSENDEARRDPGFDPGDSSKTISKTISQSASASAPEVCNLSDAMVGTRFKTFEILEVAGRGGMGMVFKARDVENDLLVALKIVSAMTQEDREPIRRFLSEARVLARLHHPNIPRIRAMGRMGHMYYLATDYIEGTTLGDLIDSRGGLTPRRALEISREISDALRVAHNHGILHRDIKSDNIMIDEEGRVKVLDFGIAKDLNARRGITQGEVYLGTPEYCSPEQLCSRVMDARTDIYSLGVVLHEMLTGQMPFKGVSTVELYHSKRKNRRPPLSRLTPGAPRVLVKLMKGFLASKPDRRYTAMEDVIQAIDEVIPKLGAYGWGRPSVRRFAQRKSGSKQPNRMAEYIYSLFF